MKRTVIRYDICAFVIIAVLGLIIFWTPIGNCDEIWNYNFSKQIVAGLRPYADINMLPTPLAAYIAAACMKVIGTDLFAFRIITYILFIAIFYIEYILCKRIYEHPKMAIFMAAFLGLSNLLSFLYNYNMLAVLVLQIIMLLEWNSTRSFWAKQCALGFLFGLFPLIKQTFGSILFLLNVGLCLVFMFTRKNERISFLIRLGISVIPGLIYFLYLCMSGTLPDFIEYAVVGVGTFSHFVSVFDLIKEASIAVAFVLPVHSMIIHLLWMLRKQENRSRIHLLWFTQSIVFFVFMVYPLFDCAHFFAGMVSVVTTYLYFVKGSKFFVSAAEYAMCGIGVLMTASLAFSLFSGDNVVSDVHNFKGIPIYRETEELIVEIDDYIVEQNKQGVDVFIADESSAVFTIPLDQYHKNWDLLLIGNVGETTFEELVDGLPPNHVVLLRKNPSTMGYQAHFEWNARLREELKKVGEVSCFDVYRNE